jgi:hypothetical protein
MRFETNENPNIGLSRTHVALVRDLRCGARHHGIHGSNRNIAGWLDNARHRTKWDDPRSNWRRCPVAAGAPWGNGSWI